jgi:hypothetical protein
MVIDYVLGNEEVRGKVGSLRVGERVDSDHQLVEVWIGGERRERKERKEVGEE